MYLKNTSKYDDEEVKSLIQIAAKGSDLRRVCVKVKNCGGGRSFQGWAYDYMPRKYSSKLPKLATRLVVVRIGAEKRFPVEAHQYAGKVYSDRKTWPVMWFETWQECMIAVAAHEFAHIYQYQNKLPRSESFCERRAAAALERYRAMKVLEAA